MFVYHVYLYRVVSKSVTAICFTQDDSLILVADKTGDVHRYVSMIYFFSVNDRSVCLIVYQMSFLKCENIKTFIVKLTWCGKGRH